MTQEHDYSAFKDDEPKVDILMKISALALEQKEAEAEVAKCEEKLKEAQNKLKDISEFRLPALMDEVGMSDFTMKDGSKIEVKESIHCKIPAHSEGKAFGWLEENKHGDIIKRQFIIEFGREQEDWAKQFQQELAQRDDPLNYKVKRDVHNSTLKSFIREQLEAGVAIPMEYFGAFKQRYTKITE